MRAKRGRAQVPEEMMQSATCNLLSTAAASHHKYFQRHLSFFPLEATSSCQRGVLQMGLGGSHSYEDVIPAIRDQ